MKKVLVLLLALSFVGVFAFADAPAFAPVVSMSGNAKVTFGVNLDAEASGISNATETDITLQLVTKATNEKGGKEGEVVYGWIKLKDFEVKIDDDDGTVVKVDGVEAKLFLGPVYINILGDGAGTAKTVPNGILKNADSDPTMDVIGLTTTTVSAGVEYKNLEATESKGIYLGLTDTAVVDVQVGVNSLYDWTAAAATAAATHVEMRIATGAVTEAAAIAAGYIDPADGLVWAVGDGALVAGDTYGVVVTDTAATAADMANTDNVYQFWAAVSLKAVENLTVEAKLGFTTNTTDSVDPLGLGVKAGYKIVIAEGYSITPTVAADLKFATDLAYRLGAGVVLGLPGAAKADKDWFTGVEADYAAGLSVQFAMDNAEAAAGAAQDNMDLTAAFFDGDLIPVVDLVAVAEFFGLTRESTDVLKQVGIAVRADADFGMVVPYAEFKNKTFGDDDTLTYTSLKVGATLKVVTNTEFTLEYASGDLSGNTAGNEKGTITFATKIIY